MHYENVLLIFAKNPKKGKVKTRLADDLGEEKALGIYHKLLEYTRDVVMPLPVDKQLWYSRYIDKFDGWEGQHFEKRLQEGEGLGERMKQAFAAAFSDGYRKAIIIGSDCAELKTGMLERAYRELESKDVVIGPAGDGGYYLLGMKTLHPQLFEGIAWSTSSVYEESRAKIESAGLSLWAGKTLHDVDTKEDWERVKDQWGTRP